MQSNMSGLRCLGIGFLVCLMLMTSREGASQDVSFEHITVEDGLPTNLIYGITQDRNGFLWIATNQGLSKFDGKTFKTYHHLPFDSTSISHDFVFDVVEWHDGTLWVSSERGLNRFNPDTETSTLYTYDENNPASVSGDDIGAIYQDAQGTLWIGTWGGGLNKYDAESDSFERYPNSSGVSEDIVDAITQAPDGTLWVGTHAGVDRLDPDTGRISRYSHDPGNPSSLSSDVVISLLVTRNGMLLVGTEDGINRYDSQTDTFAQLRLQTDDGLSVENSEVLSLYETSSGEVWAGTNNGLLRFNVNLDLIAIYKHRPEIPESLSHNVVQNLFEDRDGILWIGTWGGLNRYGSEGSNFTLFQPQQSEETGSNSVRALYSTRDAQIWIGTMGGGMYQLDESSGSYTAYTDLDNGQFSLNNGIVRTLLETRDGSFLAGTQGGGINKLDRNTGRFTFYRNQEEVANSLSDDYVMSLYEARDGSIYVGTQYNGVNKFEPSSGTITRNVFNPSGEILSNPATTILDFQEVDDGVFWIASWGRGLHRYDSSTDELTSYRYHPDDSTSLSNDVLWVIHQGRDGTLWLGTDTGLERVNTGTNNTPSQVTFTSFNSQNTNYTGGAIKGILEDEQGLLWLGLGNGKLARFNPQTRFFRYFESPSIQRIGSFTRSATIGSSGKMYFGGYGGFIGFDPALVQAQAEPPRLLLTELKIFNETIVPGPDSPLSKSLSQTEAVSLSHDQNDFSIGFTAFEYQNPDGIRFNYRLLPYDEQWRGITEQRSAPYTSLSPGHYTFEVQAVNGDGIWTPESRVLKVHIRPPWWLSFWAYMVYGIFVLGLLWGLDGMRRRRLILKERERVRERELEQAHQLKEAYEELGDAHVALKAEKQKTEAQAAQLRELDEAKSRFFANVSHEFRTPLTLTIGPLEDLQRREQNLDTDAKSQIDLALRNAYRVLDLINEILDVAKLESGRLKLQAVEQDLNTFVEERAQAFTPLAERKQISYSIDTPDEPLSLFFDAGQFEKVLANLLSNAFKFTADGGVIRVSVGERTYDGFETGKAVYIAVRDNGPGIAAEELPHVFDRFHQVNESMMRLQPGTGIGLALVKQLVERHGGEIKVESEEGFGSTFTVLLRKGSDHLDSKDLTQEAPHDVHVKRPPSAAWQRAARLLQISGDDSDEENLPVWDENDMTTVLVVEDNAEVRSYIAKYLAHRYRVLEAANGKEGLEKARMLLPDLVISDVMMPEMDGFALCSALKGDPDTAFVPVILLTARATSEDKIEGLEGGADDYLTKPFDTKELNARVDNLITSRRRLLSLANKAKPSLHANDIDVSSVDEAFLEKVHACIEAHIGDESFSVEVLADEMGLDRSSLYRRIRAILDQSPNDVIWTLRLERAAQLLEARAGTISEIAYSVGFKSVAHFSRRFQKKYGVSPSKYNPIKPA